MFSLFNNKKTKKKEITYSPPYFDQFMGNGAEICNAIYTPQDWNKMPLYIDQKPFPINADDMNSPGTQGFKGLFSYNSSENDPHTNDPIILSWAYVIRGTVLSDISDLISDLLIALNQTPGQVNAAKAYYISAMQFIFSLKDTHPVYNKTVFEKPFYFTGHSLGGVIAACMFSEFAVNTDGRVRLITYENPGSYYSVLNYLKINVGMHEDDAIKYMESMEPYIINVQSYYNIINSCQKQWGRVLRLQNFMEDFSGNYAPTFDIKDSYLFNIYYIANYTLKQHSIKMLAASVYNGDTSIGSYDDTQTFSEGYHKYLDRNEATNSNYWQEYFLYIMSNDIDIQKQYKDKPVKQYWDDAYHNLDEAFQKTTNDSFVISRESEVKYVLANMFTLFSKNKVNKIQTSNEDFGFVDLNNIENEKVSTLHL